MESRKTSLGIKFIMSLKRSTKGLDYGIFVSTTNDDADKAFLYHNRPIWWKRFMIEDHGVFLYFDEAHRSDESEDYMRRVFDPIWKDIPCKTIGHRHYSLGL